MKDFLQNPNGMFITTMLSLIFGFIGVISAFFGIKSYLAQRKTDKAYKLLLEKANRDWVGKYSEKEINKLNDELNLLTRQITKEIPNQARKALLESKLQNTEKEILQLYSEHKALKKELNKIHPVEDLDKNVRNYIEDEIINHNTKRKVLISVIIIMLSFVFFSNNMINSYMHYMLSDVIQNTNAKLVVEHITTYIMALISFTGIILLIPIKKLDWLSMYYKKIIFIIGFLFLLIWAFIVYCISFNYLIRGFYFQIVVGILSIVLFSISIKLFVLFFKKM